MFAVYNNKMAIRDFRFRDLWLLIKEKNILNPLNFML